MIGDIFERTRLIIGSIQSNKENPQIVPIMNYLLVTATYLKGGDEVNYFKKNWVEINDKIKQGLEENIWREYYMSINRIINHGLNQKRIFDNELANFYDNTFLRMYGEAKMKHDSYNKNFGDKRREHYEYIFSTKARFEEALFNGDPAAFCD